MTVHRPSHYLRGRVVTPDAVIQDGVVVVDGDTILWVGPAVEAARAGWPYLPNPREIPPTLLPGLVDVHNHGGGGAGFPDVSTPGEARVAIREHLAHGTTTLVASLVTAGAVPSFGHTDASWTQTRNAVADACARLDAAPGRRSARPTVTHLFN